MTWRRSTTERTFATQTQYQGVLQEIKAFFDDCSAEGAAFPWTVASFAWDTPSANKGYVVLKRKDASAGRIYFAATATADQNTANYLGNGTAAVGLTVGYDRTATTDSPTTAPTAGAPWGGTFRTNWLGAGYLLNSLGGTAFRLRAYTKTNADMLVLQLTTTDASQGLYGVGSFVQNLHTGLPQLGQIVCNAAINNLAAIVSAGSLNVGFMESRFDTATSTSGGNQARACTWDATNGWQRLFRLTAMSQDSGGSVANINTLWAQTTGDRYFLPIYCGGHLADTSIVQKMFRLKNFGFGECRTRLSSQLVDNSAQARGWYLGYHQTSGTDVSGLSLLDVDFA